MFLDVDRELLNLNGATKDFQSHTTATGKACHLGFGGPSPLAGDEIDHNLSPLKRVPSA